VQRLRAQVAALEAQTAQLERTVEALEQRRDTLRKDTVATQSALAHVEAERAVKAGDLEVLAALKALLLNKTPAIDAFFEELRRLDRWRTIGGTPTDVVGAGYVKDLRAKLMGLLLEMFRQAGGSAATSTPPGTR
jgi:predicted RNase H-like nuclease (RuvC/YqgF family)